MKKWFHSLRFRVMAVLLAVGLLPMLLQSRFIGRTSMERHIRSRVQEYQYQCSALATQMSRAGYFSNTDSQAALDRQIELLAGIYSGRIFIADQTCRIVKDTFALDEGLYSVSPAVLGTFRGTSTLTYHNDEHYALFTLPIYAQGSRDVIAGVLFASMSTETVIAFEQSLADRQGLFLLSLLFAMAALSILMSRFLLSPVDRLKTEIAGAAEGNRTEIGVYTSTETAEMSESFNRTLARLQQIDASRQEFVSNVSHELKTPITSIRVLADSLISVPDAPVEMYREFLSDISEEIDRESMIIEDLLTLVRLDKSGQELTVEEKNMNELLETLLRRLKPLAKRRGIEMTLECARTVTAEIDEVKMTLALSNLVENAIKYNVDGGFVRVTLNADHKFCYVSVQDSGVGIPEEDQPHVFERFYRVDKARSRSAGGTGLGLAITDDIVRMHQGAIRLASVPGEGSTFTVRFPLHYIA